MTDVSSSQDAPDPAGTGIDTTVPHSARIWNYWLGGKDNYAVDREAGDQYKAIFLASPWLARTSRAFLDPRGQVPGGRGRDAAVPRHRHRPAHREQHARGGPVRRAGVADRLRGQRPAGAGARPRPADQQPRGRYLRLPGRRHQRTRRHPGDRRQPARLHAAGRAHAHGDHGPLHRRRGLSDRAAPCRPGCPPAATSRSTTAPTPTRRSIRRSRVTTTSARSLTTCAARSNSTGSSRAWNWSSRAWCRWRTGGPTRTPSRCRDLPYWERRAQAVVV